MNEPAIIPTLKKPKRMKLLDQFGQPLSDGYCTPLKITSRLPPRDIDPCSNPRSLVKSKRAYSLERKLDGLKLPWPGEAFVNWPYSDPLPWAVKAVNEMKAGRCTDAIILCKLDTSTDTWRVIAQPALDVLDMWLLNERVQYDEPEELIAERIALFREKGLVRGPRAKREPGEKSSNNFCSVILHHRRSDAPKLESFRDIATLWWFAPGNNVAA